MDLVKEYTLEGGRKLTLVSLSMADKSGTVEYKLEDFNKKFEEYIDPKDLEIQRLRNELAAMKEKHKPVRKKKKTLTKMERLEVEQLIANGEGNPAIATQYDMSESAVSRIRIRMQKAGEDV